MRTVRGPLAGVVVLTTLSLAMAGCSGESKDKAPQGGSTAGAVTGTGSSSGDAAPAAVPTDPKQALAASTKGLVEGNFSFTVVGHEQKGSGVTHKPSNSAKASMTFGDSEFTMNMDMLYVAPDMWTKNKIKAPELPEVQEGESGLWQHIDPAKAKNIPELQFNWETSDLIGGQMIMKNVVTAKQEGSGRYTGTTDLSTVKSPVIDSDLLAELGAKAKSVPFTAALDGQGRLSTLTLKMPASEDVPAADLTVTYSGYGAATATAKPPANQTEEATAETYEIA